MKKIRMTVTLEVTDEYYEELSRMKHEINSGEMQRDFIKDSKGGVLKIKATFENLNERVR